MPPILHLALTVLGLSLAAATLPLVAELLVLSVAAVLPARQSPHARPSLRLAVVVPAHNEQQLIGACVRSLLSGSYLPSAVYVVAHNCSDATAAEASAAGATALVLNENSGHGKGAALDHGFRQALAQDAEAVLVIDADSTVAHETLRRIALALEAGAPAAQCRYIAANAGATPRTRLQGLALTAFNVLRPRGRARLGLSCGIFGNGFALSRSTLEQLPYSAHSLVEDLEYHLALVRRGRRVAFVDDATVAAEMPEASSAAATQRARWEGGRSLLRRRLTLPLAGEVLRGRLRLLEPLADLLALPTASAAVFLLAALALPLPWLRAYALTGLFAMAFSVVVAAALSEEGISSLGALAWVPLYLFFKLRQRAGTRRAAAGDAAWVRTPRNEPPKS